MILIPLEKFFSFSILYQKNLDKTLIIQIITIIKEVILNIYDLPSLNASDRHVLKLLVLDFRNGK